MSIVSIPPDEAGDPVLRHHRADLEARRTSSGSAIIRPSASMAISAARGSTRTPRRGRSTSAASCASTVEQQWRDVRRRARRAARDLPARRHLWAGPLDLRQAARRATRGGSSSRARCSTASMSRTSAGSRRWRRRRRLDGTFNLADDEPAPPQDLVDPCGGDDRASRRRPRCRSRRREMSPMARSFYSDNKRVSNARIKAGARHRAALSDLSRGARGDPRSTCMMIGPAKGRPQRIVHRGPLRAARADRRDACARSVRGSGTGRGTPISSSYRAAGRGGDDARGLADEAAKDDPLVFAVIDKATGRAEGRQSLMRITPEHGVIEIGGILWGDRIARTRVATEALYPLRAPRLRRPRLSPLRVEVQRAEPAEPARGGAVRLHLRGHLPPAHDHQGREPRHGVVRDARWRLAADQGGV